MSDNEPDDLSLFNQLASSSLEMARERLYSLGDYRAMVAPPRDELYDLGEHLCGSEKWHGAHPWYRRTENYGSRKNGLPEYVDESYWCPGVRDFRDPQAIEDFLEGR